MTSASDLQDADGGISELSVKDELRVEGRELSGLALRGSKNHPELLLISDSGYKVLSIAYNGGFSAKQYFYDLKDLIDTPDKNGRSQWEAIAVDQDHVFVLEENPGRVFVFNRDLTILEQTLILKVPKSSPVYTTWEKDPNSRGEGLVLLKNGHILIMKEKDPVQLIEFGPAGNSSSGFRPGDAAGPGDKWPPAAGKNIDFVPLKVWDIGETSRDLLKDASELTTGPDGKLYALSDQAECIVAIENVLKKTEERFKIKQSWRLPTKITKPEGMIFDDKFAPLVTSDLSGIDRNLFLLGKIH